jgi:hypothetical protein
MKPPPLFAFESRDALAQFIVFLAPLLGGGMIIMIVFDFGGIRAALVAAVIAAVLGVGLRSSILVTSDEVKIVRKWFFVPYWIHTGAEIQDVWYGGDWGMPKGAMGVVVKLEDKEVHIGTSKNMHDLHNTLYKFSVAYRGKARRDG